MTWEIASYVGAEPIKFGQSRELVRQYFTEEAKSFLRSSEDTVLTDVFNEAGVFVYYDDNDLCQAIEFFEPAEVKWQKNLLLPKTYDQLLNVMRENDDQLDEDENGFISYKHGIGAYKEDIDESQGPADTIICFQKDYYKVE
jgi:hypothetical protein